MKNKYRVVVQVEFAVAGEDRYDGIEAADDLELSAKAALEAYATQQDCKITAIKCKQTVRLMMPKKGI